MVLTLTKSQIIKNILIVTMWVFFTFGFVCSEIIPALEPLKSPLYLVLELVVVALSLFVIRRKEHLIFLALIVALGYYSTCMVNHNSFGFYLNGLRDFIPFFAIMPIYHYFHSRDDLREDFDNTMDKHLYYFLVLQAPCIIFQFLKYGAGDAVGGSLGAYNSGNITTLIYIISFYLIRKRLNTEHILISLVQNRKYILLLLPTFLNETKVGFIYMVMYFLLLVPLTYKSVMKILGLLPVILLGLTGIFYVYNEVVSTDDDVFSMRYMQMYLIGDEDSADLAEMVSDMDMDEWEEDMPRFAKIALMLDFENLEPGHRWTGFGLGLWKGGTNMAQSKFSTDYDWAIKGTVPYIFHVFMQLGILGMLLITYFWWVHLIKKPAPNVGMDYNLLVYCVLLVIIIGFYSELFRITYVGIPLMYIMSKIWRYPSADKQLTSIPENDE